MQRVSKWLAGVLCGGAALLPAAAATVTDAGASAARDRVAILVDDEVYPGIRAGLERYCAHVRAQLPVEFVLLVADYDVRSPVEIRAELQSLHYAADGGLSGAILVGHIPYAEQDTAAQKVYPAPLFYEDFDASWIDTDGDGDYDILDTDRITNATEIWTAWWVPPTRDRGATIAALQRYLDKLDRHYRGAVQPQHAMYFGAGKSGGLRVSQAWTQLIWDAVKSVNQRIKAYNNVMKLCVSVHSRGAEDFTADEFLEALRSRQWQHAHVNTAGLAHAFRWRDQAVSTDNLDLASFGGNGAVVMTTSGSLLGNFRGVEGGPADPARCLGAHFLFSPHTITVTWFGAVSPQSSGAMPTYHTELIAALQPVGDNYLAKGYYRMRNGDQVWGLERYLFRGQDEKALLGDPFVRYQR